MMLTTDQWEERLTNSQYAAAEENLFDYIYPDMTYSAEEVFNAVLEYEGIIGYKYFLLSLIENTFGINLVEIDNQ